MSLNIQCSYKLFTMYLYLFSIISKIVEFLQRWNDVKKKRKKEMKQTNFSIKHLERTICDIR